MERHRPSILHRKLRHTACTTESADEQHRREQELWAAKSRRLNEAEQRLYSSLYPDDACLRARQRDVAEQQAQHMAAQAAARQHERELEREYSCKARRESQCMEEQGSAAAAAAAEAGLQPWRAATLGLTQAEEHAARRRFEAEVSAENAALMAARSQQRLQEQQQQLSRDRQAVTSEEHYWNLGSSSARWVAPEHRHLAATAATGSISHAGRGASAAAPPPWATHTAGASDAVSPGQLKPHAYKERRHVQQIKGQQGQQPQGGMQHPWAWADS